MIVKICKNGHELTADMVASDGRCKICRNTRRRERYAQKKQSEKELLIIDGIIKICRKGHRLTADDIQKDGKCKVCAKQKRMRQKESGKSILWQREWVANMTEEQKERRLKTSRVCNARRVAEGKRNYKKEKIQRVDGLLPSYVVSCMGGGKVSDYPAPLINLKRQVIITRRYLREFKQC